MSKRRGRFMQVFVFLCVLAVPVMFLGPGVWLLGQRAIGTPVQAKVIACQEHTMSRSSAEYCQARWTMGGRTVDGDIEGSGGDDVGHTINATVRGGTAYSRSLTLPLLLVGLGLPFLVTPIRYLRRS